MRIKGLACEVVCCGRFAKRKHNYTYRCMKALSRDGHLNEVGMGPLRNGWWAYYINMEG